MRSDNAAILLAGLGRFGEALESVAKHVEFMQASVARREEAVARFHRRGSRPWHSEMAALEAQKESLDGADTLRRLLQAGDPQAIGNQLHKWERANVKAKGIDHLWVSTPFPFERSV